MNREKGRRQSALDIDSQRERARDRGSHNPQHLRSPFPRRRDDDDDSNNRCSSRDHRRRSNNSFFFARSLARHPPVSDFILLSVVISLIGGVIYIQSLTVTVRSNYV